MRNKAVQEFIQRDERYRPEDDGSHFNGWYHSDDVKRIIGSQFAKLEDKTDILEPYVFFDGLDIFTLDEMLDPLITILLASEKKFYPFIFKPELASVHYVSGFLRRNDDGTVSLILFNPTGTMPRVNLGDYGYNLRLAETLYDQNDDQNEDVLIDMDYAFDAYIEPDISFNMEVNTIYVEIKEGLLHYHLLNTEGELVTNSLNQKDLDALGIQLDLHKPLTSELLNNQLRPQLANILKKTRERNETEEKIELISSPHLIQTSPKDGGRLVSCGPLAIAFVNYLMQHPVYMANLDEQFLLPEFFTDLLEDDLTTYKAKIMGLRQDHQAVLAEIADEQIESIEQRYEPITAYILQRKDDPDAEWLAPTTPPRHNPVEIAADHPNQDTRASQLLAPPLDGSTTSPNLQTPEISNAQETPDTLDVEKRRDVIFVRQQIARFKENATSFFSINNTFKADKIEEALNKALANNVHDVRQDSEVITALKFHRIFGFFGLKATQATIQREESLRTVKETDVNYYMP